MADFRLMADLRMQPMADLRRQRSPSAEQQDDASQFKGSPAHDRSPRVAEPSPYVKYGVLDFQPPSLMQGRFIQGKDALLELSKQRPLAQVFQEGGQRPPPPAHVSAGWSWKDWQVYNVMGPLSE